ncbi:MAG: hypothetical protein JWM93_3501 [Frankiales bacterium]|nr:hypothetical protein [Frankiales bacterium]
MAWPAAKRTVELRDLAITSAVRICRVRVTAGGTVMFSGLFGLAIVANLLFWGALIWLAVWAVRRFTDPSKNALAVLEERYARGEIDENEFAARRATLTRGGTTYH